MAESKDHGLATDDSAKKSKSEKAVEDEWKFSFCRTDPYPAEPSEHWPTGGLKAFILPERVLSLKLVFDNLRNYGIAAAFGAFGSVILHNRERLPGHEFMPGWLASLSAFGAVAIACILLILNIIQSRMLFSAINDTVLAARAQKQFTVRGDTKLQAILSLVTIIFVVLEALLMAILMLILPLTIITILVTFAWFAATAKVL